KDCSFIALITSSFLAGPPKSKSATLPYEGASASTFALGFLSKYGSFSKLLTVGSAKPVWRIGCWLAALVRNSTSAAAALGYLVRAEAAQPLVKTRVASLPP